MWWLKFIGAAGILLGCTFLGIDHAECYRRRIFILKEMYHSLILFKGFGETYRLPLERLCELVIQQIEEPAAGIYRKFSLALKNQAGESADVIWKQSVDAFRESLKDEDLVLLKQVGDFLGVQDLKMQGRGLDACIMGIEQKIKKLEENLPEKVRLSRTIAWSIGGFIIVLFI